MIEAWRSVGRLSPNPISSASIACPTPTKAATSASPFTSHAVTTPSTATTRALIRAVWGGLRARNKPLAAWTMLETIPKVRAGNRARLIGVPSDHRFRAVNHWTEVVASARLAELHWWWPSQRRNAVASATSTSPTSPAGSGTVSPGGVGGPACRPRVGSGAAAGAGGTIEGGNGPGSPVRAVKSRLRAAASRPAGESPAWTHVDDTGAPASTTYRRHHAGVTCCTRPHVVTA